MDRRSFLKRIGALGLAAALGVKTAVAQDAPKINADLLKAAVQEELLKKNSGAKQSPYNLTYEKMSIDYLVEAFVPAALYANHEGESTLFVSTAQNDKYGSESNFIIDKNNIQFSADASVDGDSEITGYTNDGQNDFNFKITGLDERKRNMIKNMTSITFQGRLANKDISYTLTKDGELPTRIEGQWNNLEFIVTYTPAKSPSWLVERANVKLRDLTTTKLVAEYEIVYQQGERKVQAGTAIGYKGFTVTKK